LLIEVAAVGTTLQPPDTGYDGNSEYQKEGNEDQHLLVREIGWEPGLCFAG
jgi:hypothetical protein